MVKHNNNGGKSSCSYTLHTAEVTVVRIQAQLSGIVFLF